MIRGGLPHETQGTTLPPGRDHRGDAGIILKYGKRLLCFRFGSYDEETVQAVEGFRKAHDLDHEGNERGLVDEALVNALRSIYFAASAPD